MDKKIDHKNLIEELEKRDREKAAIIHGISAVLQFSSFEQTAETIFNTCKKIIGASSGYVALLSDDGHENEVLYLDSGGLTCQVDPNLPMPIRGLREKAYQQKKAVYDNGFNTSKWMAYIPKGHVQLNNVLFTPLLLKGEAVGLMGMANKKNGFTDNDAELALIFGNLAAAALHNSRVYEKLTISQQRFKSLIEAARSIIIAFDLNYRIFEFNHFSEQLFHIKREQALGKNFFKLLFGQKESEKMKENIQQVLRGEMVKDFETKVTPKQTQERTVSWSMTEIKDIPDIEQAVMVIGQDITERKKIETELEYLSYHDSLTGTYNRIYFEEELKRLDTPRQLPLSMIMIDLNNLKDINDKKGHLEGDKLLKKAVSVVKKSCRKEDVLARWGGDEFTILLPGTDAEAAHQIKQRIEKLAHEQSTKDFPISLAIGAATKTQTNTKATQVIKEAEDRMYADKRLKKSRR